MPDESKTELPTCKILWGPVFIALGIFVISTLLAFYVPAEVRKAEGQKWTEPLKTERTRMPSLANLDGPEHQKTRLVEQAQDIIKRAEHHLEVMVYFQSNYYVGILLRNIFAGLAGLSLFLVARRGWEKANMCMVSFFLAVSACAAFYVAFPDMFRQEENVAKNKGLYLNYVALLNDIHTFAATNELPKRDEKADHKKSPVLADEPKLSTFIQHVNDEMKRLNDIAVAFDAGKFAVYKFETGK